MPPECRTVDISGVVLRVSEEGKAVCQEVAGGWVELGQVADRWGRGYLRVCPAGVDWSVAVHRVVAMAFHGPQPPGKPLVEHLDGSKRNNHRDNVRWASYSDNLRTAFQLGERKRHYPAQLDAAGVYRVRKHRKQEKVSDIAQELGVGVQTIRDVIARQSWRRVRDDQPYLF
jgi:hypothetical protein